MPIECTCDSCARSANQMLCDTCLREKIDEAREAGKEEGYKEGHADGYEEAEDKCQTV